MGIRRMIDGFALMLALLGVACLSEQSWGQEDQRIGTVLAVDGTFFAAAADVPLETSSSMEVPQ